MAVKLAVVASNSLTLAPAVCPAAGTHRWWGLRSVAVQLVWSKRMFASHSLRNPKQNLLQFTTVMSKTLLLLN